MYLCAMYVIGLYKREVCMWGVCSVVRREREREGGVITDEERASEGFLFLFGC